MHPLPFAAQSLWRNKLLTGATLLIMTLILFIFNVMFTVNLMAHAAIQALDQKIDLILYLKEGADPLLVEKLVQELKTLPEVVNVTHTTKTMALQELQQDFPEELGDLTLENPLPASIQILTQKPEDQTTVLNYIQESSSKALLGNIEQNDTNRAIVKNLIAISNFTEKLLLGIMITFLAASVLMVANAIHLTIFSRRRELQVMQLVGAKPQVIRTPFLIEGAFYGIASALIALLGLAAFTRWVDFSMLGLLETNIPYVKLGVAQIVIGATVGMASSALALHVHLKRS